MTLRMLTPLLLLLAVVPGVAGAQPISFAPPVQYDSATSPYSVAIGDLNADGKPDLVVVNTGVMPDGVPPAQGDGVNVLLGTGSGQFAPALPFTVGPSPAAVAIADFNGDGIPDLAVGSGAGFAILLGNGLPTLFNPATTFPVGGAPYAIAVGDFNEDGHLDLAMPNNNSVTTLLGAGDGTFGSLTHYPVGFVTIAVAIADFDGDGHQDLAVASMNSNTPDSVAILLGNGLGAFGPATNITAGTQPFDLAVGDFNQDGKPDLAVGTGVGTVSVLLNTGGGTFASPLELFMGLSVPAISIEVADLNGDCVQDIIVAAEAGSVAVAFAGTGTGSFGPAVFFDASVAFNSAIAVGDLNGDGRVDAVIVNRSIDKVSVLLNIGAVFAPSSLAPKNVSLNAGASRFPDIAVSGCYVYAVWEDYTVNPSFPAVLLARSADRGVTYGAAITIGSDPGGSQGPQVAVSGSNVYVIWIRPFDGEIVLKASHDHGLSFGSTVNVSNSFDSSANPVIAASGQNIYVAWRESVWGGNTEIMYARSTTAGNTFSVPVNLSNTPLSSATPAIAAEGSKVYLAWEDDQPNAEIAFRASDNFGASFAPTVNLSNDAGASFLPSIATSGNLAYVVWTDSLAGTTEVLLKPIVYNGVFSIGATMNVSANASLSEFATVAAAGNDAYVSWQDNAAGNYDILFRRVAYDGVSFTMDPGTQNLSANPSDSRFQQLAAAGNSVYVAWLDKFNLNFEVFLRASNDHGATFGTTSVLSQNGQGSFEIAIAAAEGSAFVAWRGNVASNAEVFVRTQTTVVSAGAATGAGTVTFATSAGGFSNLTSVPESSLPQAGKPAVSFPYGFFNWTIANLTPGATVTITMTFPAVVPAGTQYWKVIGGMWTDVSSLVGSNDGLDNVLTLTIADGGLGDADGAANGQITDPGGIASGAQPVVVQLKGGGATSPINPRSKGRLPVAILTTSTFDAASVAIATIRFGTNGTETAPLTSMLADADGDGDLDLMLHFDTQSTGLTCGATTARLTGATTGGASIQGLTAIRTVGCK